MFGKFFLWKYGKFNKLIPKHFSKFYFIFHFSFEFSGRDFKVNLVRFQLEEFNRNFQYQISGFAKFANSITSYGHKADNLKKNKFLIKINYFKAAKKGARGWRKTDKNRINCHLLLNLNPIENKHGFRSAWIILAPIRFSECGLYSIQCPQLLWTWRHCKVQFSSR